MGELVRLFNQFKSDEGRYLHKITSYANVYEKWLNKFIGTEVYLVELGILHGGCLQMWRTYLGSKAYIYGMDHRDNLLYEEPQIKCFLIDQDIQADLDSIHQKVPRIDIFIDDASHFGRNQIATFEAVISHISYGGLYFCEDTHTSYRDTHEGGYLKSGTAMEFFKGLTDSLNYPENTSIYRPDYINSIESITFYRSLIVVKKCEALT